MDSDVRRFLKENLDLRPGKIVDVSGKIIGIHQGLSLFTIGQRHGLGIGGGKPYYVIGADKKKNQLIVTSDPKDKLLYKKSLIAKNVNWVGPEKPRLPLKCRAAIRYRHKPEKATVNLKQRGNYIVLFTKQQRAVSPGQAVVFYQGNEVLGGGTIGS